MIRKTIRSVRDMRDRVLDTWENRDAIRTEARKDWDQLPTKWRARDRSQTATIAAFAFLVIGVIALTVF